VLGNIALVRADPARALELFDESIEVTRRFQDAWGLSIVLLSAGGLRIMRGDFDRAAAIATEALDLCDALDDPRGIACGRDLHASLRAAAGQAEAAAMLWGAADALLATVNAYLAPTVGWIRARYVEPVRASVGTSFEATLAAGRAMNSDKAIALARGTWPRGDGFGGS
jgi:hypothetical protein